MAQQPASADRAADIAAVGTAVADTAVVDTAAAVSIAGFATCKGVPQFGQKRPAEETSVPQFGQSIGFPSLSVGDNFIIANVNWFCKAKK